MASSIEQITTKVAGTVKAVAAGFKGLRGVFLHLAEEHGEVGSLMMHVSKTTDPKVRREHFPHIRAELLSHEKGELAEVYGVLANHEQLRGVVLEHNSEAHTLEKAIADVDVHGQVDGARGFFSHLSDMAPTAYRVVSAA